MRLGDYDGLVTEASDLALMVKMIADCGPIILFDPVKRLKLALVHSGWPAHPTIGQKP